MKSFKLAEITSIDKISEISTAAKKRIGSLGISQWQKGYPNRSSWIEGINDREVYLILNDGDICGVFALTNKAESSYENIDGEWLNIEHPYMAVHRVCVAEKYLRQGISGEIFSFAMEEASRRHFKSIRIDTHPGNIPMQKALEKAGFKKCGNIKLDYGPEKGDERLAYEYIIKRPIILASASPRRRELLMQIGLAADKIEKSDVNEDIDEKDPEKFVLKLSRLKALDVSRRLDGDKIIIGSDTAVVLDDEILGKPKDYMDAYRMIKSIEGRSHYVYTAVSIVSVEDGKEEIISFVEKTEVFVNEMSDEEINWYISTNDPYDKAGAYGIQGFFARFVKGIKGDYNTVVGLPVSRIYKELKKLGIENLV